MKTIEEAAREYASTRSNENEIQFILDKEAFKSGIKFANQWIPVEKELPKKEKLNCKYEAKCDDIVQSAWYNEEHRIWVSLVTMQHIFPTHWRTIEFK